MTETSLPPILHHTKALKVLLMNDRRKYKVKTTKIYAAYLVKMLKAVPSLQSFAYVLSCFYERRKITTDDSQMAGLVL